ncbi:TonB-dependent receptor [Novosphingobium mangrovi (ex Hu et al. 2023)]|uniref:TonB-dependent receptor n=1 Tax=Novosphingobium mangrovi (ex Hu et al. 2023) TaxID=2930094 RepID=A0ABT0AE00_9SPHN|nr:TonB-dependent receptor [Novosphingobium mangrovi (ex Hu et al. 2023)]MCJ1961415.1 TonB-dependent receptor [Novosphingobium mangrovi (ex Hu et al. 2023)]
MKVSLGKLLLAASALTAIPQLAIAQESEQEDGFNEIVVTSQRTEQRLQDVPLSVTAISPEEIATRQILAPTDVARLVPNLKLDGVTGGSAGLKAYIRGGGGTDGGYVMSEAEVALYVNDVYNARMQGALMDFAEIERIEVLRGPQGVLYGRNASAGAINIITKQPADVLTGTAQVGYGTWNERRVKGYLSVPLSADGEWAASVNGIARKRDGGRQYNPTLGRKVGAEDFQGGMFDLAYKGSDVTARLNVYYMDLDSDGQWSVNTVTDGEGNITPLSGSYRTVLSPVESYTAVTQKGASLKLTANYPGGTLTSITAYSELDDAWRQDFSGGVYPAMLGMDGDTPLALMDRESISQQWQFSQETNATGSLADDLIDYVIGVYYFHENGDQVIDTTTFFVPSTTNFHAKTDAWAGYGQFTLNVSDELAFIAGGRYTLEDKELNADIDGLPAISRDHYEKFTPKLGVNFTPLPDLLVYGSYSVGFKSGGYNGLASTAAQLAAAFRPQTTDAFEVGLKTDLGRTLRLAVSGFVNKVQDRQESVSLGDGGFLIENYDLTIKGIEAEIAWKPVLGLQIWGNGSLNDGKYRNVPEGASLTGNVPPFLPDYQATIGFDYNFDLGEGTVKFGADANFRDAYFSTADNLGIGAVDSTQIVNGYVGYDIGPWKFQVAGKNLFNQINWQTGFGFSVVNPRFMTDPRTVLGTVRYSF